MKKLIDYIEESRIKNDIDEDLRNSEYIKEKIRLDKLAKLAKNKRLFYNLFSLIMFLFGVATFE